MAGQPVTSKKRSGSRRQQPDPPTIFLDECVDCGSLADALTDAGVQVERHRDHFAPATPDVDWLGPVSQNGWVILTKDKRQRRIPLEIAAIAEADAREFVIRGAGLTGDEIAERAVANLKRITNVSRSQPAPFIAHITKTGVRVVERPRSLRSRTKRHESTN